MPRAGRRCWRGWTAAGRGERSFDVLRHALPANALVGLDLGISLPFVDKGAFFPGWAESPADAKALWAADRTDL